MNETSAEVIILPDLLKNLYFPIWVVIIGSLVVFLVQIYHKRMTLNTALIVEINFILKGIDSVITYLEREDHYWLIEGKILKTAPMDTTPPARLYHSSVSDLYLLKKSELVKVFTFYQLYEKTETLKNNLFARIKEYANLGVELEQKDIERLSVERLRVARNYKAIFDSVRAPIRSLTDLSDSYSTESTAIIAEMINKISND